MPCIEYGSAYKGEQMKKHKQHLIDHNTLESTAQNADSTPTPTTQPPQDSNPTPSTQDSTTQLTKAVTPTLTPSQQDSSQKAESSPTLCACSEFVYLGSLPYTLRLPTGKTYPLHQGDSFIVPQGDLSRYLEYKSTMFKKLR